VNVVQEIDIELKNIRTVRTHYEKLAEKLNCINRSEGKILNILPCYCGQNEYFFTVIYSNMMANLKDE